jgi:hypothetical protein
LLLLLLFVVVFFLFSAHSPGKTSTADSVIKKPNMNQSDSTDLENDREEDAFDELLSFGSMGQSIQTNARNKDKVNSIDW